ncbi:MAG: Type 1 glutamine amidotransferase-like domain-containing protein [Candidatus Woesearchaeota archaeon]
MVKEIILIGGGSVIKAENKVYLKKINEYIKSLNYNNLLFVSAASNDSLEYYENIKRVFHKTSRLGFDNKHLSNRLIKKADIIYLGGGDTAKLINFLEDIKFKDKLKKKHVLVGFSAGAIALCSEGFSLKTSNRFKGLGLIKRCAVPHFKGQTLPKSLTLPLIKLKDGQSNIYKKNKFRIIQE